MFRCYSANEVDEVRISVGVLHRLPLVELVDRVVGGVDVQCGQSPSRSSILARCAWQGWKKRGLAHRC